MTKMRQTVCYCVHMLAYSVSSDNVEFSCVIIGLGGSAGEHLEQLLDAPLQQPVNQSLQQWQLRGREKEKNIIKFQQ